MKNNKKNFVENAAPFLAVAVSSIFILVSSFGYLATFAKANNLRELSELHASDYKTINKKIDENEKARKRDALILKSEDYTDKINAIELKPRKTIHDRSMLSYYRDKKDDLKTRLGN